MSTERYGTRSSLHGDIDELGIADDLQALILSSTEGCVALHHSTGTGYVSFRRGIILAVITDHKSGIEGLAEILKWNSGSFELDKTPQPKPQLGIIDLPLTIALLAAHQSLS